MKIIDIAYVKGALSHYLATSHQSRSSFVIEDYLKILRLFPVACRFGWHGWKWIETLINWPIFSSFDATCWKNPQEIYYG